MSMVLGKVYGWVSDRWLSVIIGFTQFIFPILAFADGGLEDPDGGTNFGAISQNLLGQVTSFIALLWSGAAAFGIITTLGGILMWKRIADGKSQKENWHAIVAMIAGVLIYFLHATIHVGGNTTLNG